MGASWYFFEKFIRLVGAFLVGSLVARHLGPESYGALAYAVALVAVLGFLGSLGIESLVVRDLVEAQRNAHSILSTYFVIRLAGALLVPLLATGFLMTTHANDPMLLHLAVLCGSAVVFGAWDTADIWLQARNEARKTSLIRLIGFTVGATSRCLLILMDATVEWFATILVLESVVIASLYLRLLRRNGMAPSWGHVNLTECNHLIVAGKMMILSGLTVAIYSKIDVLVVGALLSKEDLGSYAIAASMCAAWNMVGMSVTQAWAPRLSAARRASISTYLFEIRSLLKGMLAISLIGSLILTIAANQIINLLLGSAYEKSVELFKILIWASIPIFLGISTSQIIVNERVYWISLLRTTFGMTISLIAIVPAVKFLGPAGAALVVIVSASLNIPLALISKDIRGIILAALKIQTLKAPPL
jgi:polysaccharide transporter, PST family